MNMFCSDVNFVSYLEIQRIGSMPIGVFRRLLLGLLDLSLEFLLKIVEVDSEIQGLDGSDVAFRINGNIRMIPFVGVEW